VRFAFPLFVLAAACSFDYSLPPENSSDDPAVIMNDMEYVRMENSRPVVRLRSKEARRYEEKHIMELDDFSFEQYDAAPETGGEIPAVNVRGAGSSAKIQTDSGDLVMSGGVSVDVASEDISLFTENISWKDAERLLSAPEEVTITRQDGTRLSGQNFFADTRRREWRFEGALSGDIVEADETAETADGPAAAMDGTVAAVDDTTAADRAVVEK
jgi:LPS export ABC transporter protein LptC